MDCYSVSSKTFCFTCLIFVITFGIITLIASGGGGNGDDVSGEPDDTTAPSTPTGLAAEADTSTTVYLSWDASTDNVGVAGYLIYRDGDQIIDLYDPEYLEYDDADLTPETNYSYTVSAYDPTGNESAQSAQAEVTTLPIKVAQFGTPEDDTGRGLGVDTNGNVYVAGNTTGSFPGTSNLGGQDVFVRKFNSDKETQWTIQVGTAEEEKVNTVAVEPNGNVYIAGRTNGIWKYQSVVTDCFLAKYNSNGVEQWVLQPATVWEDDALSVAVDSVNNRVYLTGLTTGAFPGFFKAGGLDIFLAQFDLDGEQKWLLQDGTVNADVSWAIALDSVGNVYIAGQTYGDLDGAGSGVHEGGSDAFLRKYNSSGTLQWTAQWGTSSFDYADGVAVDISGNIYVTGITEGTLYGASSGNWDIFLAKYDSSGSQQWIRQTGSSQDDGPHGLAISSDGNIYVVGNTLGLMDDIGAGGGDICLVVYDSDGNLLDQTQGGSSGSDGAGGIVMDTPRDCFYITGVTDGGVDGNTNLGGLDALLIKMSLEGELQ